jgi:hypothetical protein
MQCYHHAQVFQTQSVPFFSTQSIESSAGARSSHATKVKELRDLVAQNVMVRMSVSSGFRKYRTKFSQLSRLAAAINNHPESAMMSINRVVESKLP